jgi:demethylmenaquinone methyltransferase/2-methoxy-6-polyprenyl-1,4-benzoquinol methylase
MTETTPQIRRLLESNPLRAPLLRAITQALQLPAGSCGLDAGCGIGLQTQLLLEAVGPDGQVTGLDINPELLAYGRGLARRAGVSDQVSFQAGRVERLPFEDQQFDWVWSADCVGYPAGDLAPFLGELIRVLKPGGSGILLGWSSQQLLPGYALLEARLNATCSGYLPFLEGNSPATHFLRTPQWMRQAGLEEIRSQTFISDIQAPLGKEMRAALQLLFEMLWGEPQPRVSAEDWQEYQRLCLPGSPDFILDIPDYYGFYTYTVFRGEVPA